MTSKERFLKALNRQKPDRLPVTTHHMMPSFLKQYMNGIPEQAFFEHSGNILDPVQGPMSCLPVAHKHGQQQEKLKAVVARFEDSVFNTYTGPRAPELLLITGSVCYLYSKEAISLLGVEGRVGLLKLGTTWPLPPELIKKYLNICDSILVVEEVIPFLEENLKIIAAELGSEIGPKMFFEIAF